MKWLEVAVTVEPRWQEALYEIFTGMGIQSVEIIDPDEFRKVIEENRYLDYVDDGFIEHYGNRVVMKAYFQSDRDKALLENNLVEAFFKYGIQPFPQYMIRLRDDSEWKDNWKKYYRTFSISKRVFIRPSWEKKTPMDGKTVIELDPGMAFGTGMHETTRMCASLLDDIITGDEKVLDLGCGTGILGILAAKLGVSEVICVDIDDAACKTAIENVHKNKVSKVVKVIQGQLENVPVRPYHIIVVNIIADIILSLLPEIKKYCNAHTHILLSGIIQERKQDIQKAISQNGYHLERIINEGEWVAMQICIDF